MALTQVQAGVLGSDSQYTGFKNRIINGAMVIDQRYTGSAFSISQALAGYCTDRFSSSLTGATVATLQQSSIAPVGFAKSLSLTVTTPDSSVTGTDIVSLWQRIEGYNWSDLNYGTSAAQTSTLSFWVRSSIAGQYGVRLSNNLYDRSYVAMYSIISANTWEYKTITISGDVAGTWVGATNNVGLVVEFCLGTGSTYQTVTTNTWQSGNYVATSAQTNLISTNGATFYITGVQLEKGSTATSFDYRPYGTELQLAQRYCPVWDTAGVANQSLGSAYIGSTNSGAVTCVLPVTPRVVPTGVSITGTTKFTGTTTTTLYTLTFSGGSSNIVTLVWTAASGLTGGQAGTIISDTGGAKIIFTGCEL